MGGRRNSRPAAHRRGRSLAAGQRAGGIRRHPARPGAGPGDAAAIAADQHRSRRARPAEGLHPQLRRRRADRHPAPGRLGGWRAHPLCADRPPGGERPGARPGAGAPLRLWRLPRLPPALLLGHGGAALAGEGRHRRHRPDPRRRRVRHRRHEAGRGAAKARSHDDFAAIAADLVARGVTVPGRIAAEGGSNGGLLIANMLTRYPERFGALFCTIPLIDMRRYTKLLAGASWIAEYGDPEKPEEWDFIRAFSAYHAAEPGRPYPPILLATTRRDDRVHPGHARKMAAKLQALGYDAGFYEPEAGGHGYGKDNGEVASFSALGAAFLRRAIGWEEN
ncbi:prolyl oligopeptidase family serine peptidase [Teichococcus aestuarii]|uniref:prolyl oligopeptidase family serine peptidase n=1 Tax=Teichococcus aestuarii TaxID=568898 RepID=UPI003613C6CE